MKKTTRIISLFLTLAMIITMAVPMTASAAFTDVDQNHSYYEAINNLSAEGILNGFEDGSFKPSDPVTRAQFTKIICYALSVGNITYSTAEKSIFTDVAPEHWAANNIVTAYRKNIINGMGDGTFAPEANVNFEQAVKMVVCALGHTPEKAERLGGYPHGYLSIANKEKVIAGITDSKIGQPMNRGAVAKLIDNMMDADQVIDGEVQGSIRDDVSTGDKVNAQLVAAYGVSLYDDATNPCYKNQIELALSGDHEENLFDISELKNFDIDKYLGRYVTVYYELEEGSENRVVTDIVLQPKKNEEIKIDLDLISDYDNSSIEYYTDTERQETETVYYSAGAKKLFNGEYTTTAIDTLLNSNVNKSGQITLISTAADDIADVVFLKAYDMMVVSHVDRTNKRVYGKNAPYTGGIVLDVDDGSKDVTITKNGKEYALTSIRQNDILSIAKSTNGNVIEVMISSASGVAGNIYSMDSQNKQITLDSGSKTYTLLDGIYVQDGVRDDIDLGKHVTIYLDSFGKVARLLFTAEKEFDYGYVSAVDFDEKKSQISVMLYKASSYNSTLSAQEYYFADRVKVNGQTKSLDSDIAEIKEILSTDAVNAKPTGVAASNDTYSQPVRYSVNSQNKINAIVTVGNTLDEKASKLSLKAYQSDGVLCTLTGASLGGYSISGNTKVIYIPENRTAGTYYSKDNNFFKKSETTKYYAQFANVSDTKLVSCIYLYGVDNGGNIDISASITEDTMPMIVKSKTGVNIDNSDKKFVLVDVTTGAETTCYDNDIEGTATLAEGDVVRVALEERTVYNDIDGSNKNYKFIEVLEVLADADEVVAGTYSTLEKIDGEGSGIDYDFRTLIGTVKAKDSLGFIIVPGYSVEGTEEPRYEMGSARIYMVDTKADKDEMVRNASSDEFDKDGIEGISSRIMIYTKDAKVRTIIIFN